MKVTMVIDPMGALHVWRGTHRVEWKGKYRPLVDGQEADLYIQDSQDVEVILALLPNDLIDEVREGWTVTCELPNEIFSSEEGEEAGQTTPGPEYEVVEGYDEWSDCPCRKRSPEVDFGVWWRVPGSRWTWRVSWIQQTGELYARELAPNSDRFIVLGAFPTREEVEARMSGWADGDRDLAQFFPGLTAEGM